MHAVLQVLLHTPGFLDFLRQHVLPETGCAIRRHKKFCLIHSLMLFSDELDAGRLTDPGEAFQLTQGPKILSHIDEKKFTPRRQQDAHEFLAALLRRLERDELRTG